jgi:hypothetical protein
LVFLMAVAFPLWMWMERRWWWQCPKHYTRLPRRETEQQERGDGMPASADERHLRRLLAVRLGIPGAYYDEGEAQGAQHGISIDFMREPVADIEAKLRALNVARAEMAQQEQEPVARRVRCVDPVRDWTLAGYHYPVARNVRVAGAQKEQEFSHAEIARMNEAWLHRRAAGLAQQEPEPVAWSGVTWGVDWGRDGDQSCCTIIKRHADGTQEVVAVEYGPPRRETEQEPVAWGLFAETDGEWVLQHPVFVGECGKANAEAERASYNGPTPLEVRPLGVITGLPRREWQGLTEEEKADILFPLTAARASDMDCARAIEAKLKEKNHE